MNRSISLLLLLLFAALPAEARHGHAHHGGAHHKASGSGGATAPDASAEEHGGFSTVVIDAGHGGFDPGGIPENLMPEKGVALDVAQRLRKALEAAGVHTVMTRDDDTFITLGERVRIANAQRDAIFVSIHFNATERADARGVETYYGSAASEPLAELIQEHLLSISVNPDFRPVKHADFWVLRKTSRRAVLAECGFLTNAEDTALAQQEEYRQKLAAQIAAAILEYRASVSRAG